ncbi:MAG: hypothetical protein ISS57_01015 [Anaerolineales bacterium]|nr:hypothetical protein [Anaerolineales bacterium]
MFTKRRLFRISFWLIIFLILLGVFTAFAAVNIVPSGFLDEDIIPVSANDLKPDECNIINLSNIVNIGNGDSPTSGNDLILGTDKNDVIDGLAGDDCILGGDKNDTLVGGDGDDVILGGDKKDSAVGGDGYDICYGGGGSDKAGDFDCEEVYIP